MNFQDQETQTGWRPVFHEIPYTRNMAHKVIMPLGMFYSPFIANADYYKTTVPTCAKCRAAICPQSIRNKHTKQWLCAFCGSASHINNNVGSSVVEEYVEGKTGENGIFFIIDRCLPKIEFDSVKETLIKTILKMPRNIFAGLISYDKNVFIHDFSKAQSSKMVCLKGNEDYSTNNYQRLRQTLGLFSKTNPRMAEKTILQKYYVPLGQYQDYLIENIQQLQSDQHYVPRQLRDKRATGCAMQIAINLISATNINTRFVAIFGGPCTVGPGKIVDLPHKATLRSYIDIFDGNENAQNVKSATTYYDNLTKLLVQGGHTMDMWAFGVDQFGLLEMKNLSNQTGGMLAMHEEFNHFIFQTSFQTFYEEDEQGLFKFPVATQLILRVPKELKLNGIIGTCKSLNDNVLKTASDMEIGEGATNIWYLGGIEVNSALCILLSHSELTNSENKEKNAVIQAITTFRYSDNVSRTRVSTMCFQFVRESGIMDMMKRFDVEAATVMLARIATTKAEIEDILEVKKWLDRILLKFMIKFAKYNRQDPSSFRMPNNIKRLPQFIYHLRRSTFINPFGGPPDQSVYMKTCLRRESIDNCAVMIQPALLKYTVEELNPVPVELDLQQLREDVVLLLDTYFNVLVWFGDHIQAWKHDKVNEDPEFAHLTNLFQQPIQDASEILYDRLPVSNFYETHKNHGKERILKSKVNPSKNTNREEDGHFVSEDAPIKLFMEYLVRNVVTYNE